MSTCSLIRSSKKHQLISNIILQLKSGIEVNYITENLELIVMKYNNNNFIFIFLPFLLLIVCNAIWDKRVFESVGINKLDGISF